MKEKTRNQYTRAKILGYGISLAVSILLIAGLLLYLPRFGSDTRKASSKADKKKKSKQPSDSAKDGHPIQAGTFEASGVAQVPGTDGFLFIDDNNANEVFWMQLNEAGDQVGAAKPVALGTSVQDPEGITSDGSSFYIISSLSKGKSGNQPSLVRFGFDAAAQKVTKAEAMENLRDFLLENVPELKSKEKGHGGGLNIEGLAWDPAGKRLILGLRSPVINGQAIAIALKLTDAQGPFSTGNLALQGVIKLPLDGLGIRAIEYDDHLKSFLIIAGAPEQVKKTDFKVWEWNGASDNPAVRETSTLDLNLQPEGITPARIGGSDFMLVVCDTSRLIKLDYADKQ